MNSEHGKTMATETNLKKYIIWPNYIYMEKTKPFNYNGEYY